MLAQPVTGGRDGCLKVVARRVRGQTKASFDK
ncbi:MAG: hypothetical protein ACI814_000649, partial [Mariniblastus sp.]